MTLLPSISAGAVGLITYQPLPDVEPFSIRSAASYEEILSTIRVWIRDVLVPYLNTDTVQANFDTNVNTLIDTVNKALSDQAATVNAALNQAVQELANGDVPISDPVVVAILNTTSSATVAWLAAHYGNDFRPETYVQDTDNGDWALAIGRAVTAATAAGRSVLLSQLYPCASTVTLPSNASLVGLGAATGLQAPSNAPVTLLSANGATNLHLENFLVDGNARTLASKNYTRAVQIVNSTKVRAINLSARYCPDWAVSFEQSTSIKVRGFDYESGDTSVAGASANGGRDGLHFLDCSDVDVNGVNGHSYDDLIGITSKTANIARIRVRNVTGISETAALVTVGNETGTAFSGDQITIENVAARRSGDYVSATPATKYIVKVLAQNGGKLTNVNIANVNGVANNYGLWVNGNATGDVDGLNVSNVRVESTGQNGVQIGGTTHFMLSNVVGKSNTATTDGVHIQYSNYGAVHGGGSVGSGMWGVQLNTCVSVSLWGLLSRDNGALAFASNTGGNLRTASTTDCAIYGGQYVGASNVSYYGRSTSGDTNLNVTAVPPVLGGSTGLT